MEGQTENQNNDATKTAAPNGGAGNQTEPAAVANPASPDQSKSKPSTLSSGDAEPSKVEAKTDAGAASEKSWREIMAGGDEKELKRLERFASPEDVYKAYREFEKKKSAGELRTPFPKDGGEEEVAAWRKENGIPDSPEGYDLTFDDGLVIGEEDKPLIDSFLKSMHGKNATPDQVKDAVQWYYETQKLQAEERAHQDAMFKNQSLESLREEWGDDFKTNVSAVNNFLEGAGEDVRELFETGRTGDGQVLGNHPAVLKWIAQMARELNPTAGLIPSSLGNQEGALDGRISELEDMIADTSSKYWKGSDAAKLQNEYQRLLDAKEKIESRK